MAHDPLQYNARNTGLALNRLNAFPIDSSELWDKVGSNGKLLWHDPAWGDSTTNDIEVDTPQELADKYADCSISYTGQIISVIDPQTGATFVFKIDDDGTGKKATLISDASGVPKIDVDSSLSNTSENPVQNKVITNALNNKLVYHESTYVEVGETQPADNFNCYGAKIDLTKWSTQFGDLDTRYLNSIKVSCRDGNYNNLTTSPLYAVILKQVSDSYSIVGYSTESLSFGLDKDLTFTFDGLIISKNDVISICFSDTNDGESQYQQIGVKVARDNNSNCGCITDTTNMSINDTWMPVISMYLYNEKETYVSYTDQNGVVRKLGEDDGIANYKYVEDKISNLKTVSAEYVDTQNNLLHRYSEPPYFYYNITQDNKQETIRLCSPYNVWIDWGDGSDIQHVYNSSENTVVNFSHTYVNSGVYSCYFYGSARDIGVLSEESNISSLQIVSGDLSALNLEFLGYTPGMGRNYDHRGAFENCKNLMYFYVPSECKQIGNNCFKNCTSLMGLSFFRQKTTAVNSLRRYVFDGCTSLTTLNLRKTLITSTETSTFEGSSLQNIYFPENYSLMQTNAFGSTITTPKTVNLYFYGVSTSFNIAQQPSNLTLKVYMMYGYPSTYTYGSETKQVDGYIFLNKSDQALYDLIQQTRQEMVTADDDLVTVSDS